MATIKLTQDFKEFLQLLNSEKIEYLLIGGYAVGLHGYVRGTGDMDVWIATNEQNFDRMLRVLELFGFSRSSLSRDLFTGPQHIIRMGVPPNRLEILTKISGVDFGECYERRSIVDCDGLQIPLISYEDLRRNKLSSGRAKDIGDVTMLEKRRAIKKKPAES